MSLRNTRRLVALALVVLTAAAAWLMPRHPGVAGMIVALVAAVGLFQWRAHVASGRVTALALRCDLDALEVLATRGSVLERTQALIAFLHHGGFDRGVSVSLCVCGTCENDALSAELESLCRIARLSWGGDGVRAYALTRELAPLGEELSEPVKELIARVRIVTRLVSYAAAEAEEPVTRGARPEWVCTALTFVESTSPALLWPARLAAAREAAARDDFEVAREHLAGMPCWPEGSPLERARRDLVASVGARGAAVSE